MQKGDIAARKEIAQAIYDPMNLQLGNSQERESLAHATLFPVILIPLNDVIGEQIAEHTWSPTAVITASGQILHPAISRLHSESIYVKAVRSPTSAPLTLLLTKLDEA